MYATRGLGWEDCCVYCKVDKEDRDAVRRYVIRSEK